jgi:hypothetical protein
MPLEPEIPEILFTIDFIIVEASTAGNVLSMRKREFS